MKTRRKRPAKNAGSDVPSDQDESREAIELWKAACDRVSELHDMAQKRPELLRPIARQIFVWPGFISRKKRAFDTENDALMDKIELGAGVPFSMKKWQISAVSTQFAIRLYSLCRTYEKQWQLPPLTKKTKRLWFERVWRYAVNDLGVVPENNPHLAKLGQSATRTRSGWDAKYRGRPCDVRAEIKRQLWNAFNVLIG
jgi:hypothetical protein